MKKVLVRTDAYFDSVFLMLLSSELKSLPGVSDAVVAMGTTMNLELLASLGYAFDATATPNDLVIAVECGSAEAIDMAMASASELLAKKRRPSSASGCGVRAPGSLATALEIMPDANLAVISLPGAYAGREARKALERGLHVMLFSDNVSLDEELALKTFARERGLLVMGPDCGTAILNGKPLCFANAVRRGPVGIVAASGTGLQEVSCLLDRWGSGVSQAIGTGGRDLKDERVGGITMLMGIAALARDPATKVLLVVSKPPAPAVAGKVTAALEAACKDAVVHFIGLGRGLASDGLSGRSSNGPSGGSRVRRASNLEEAAGMAAALAAGKDYEPRGFSMPEEEIEALVLRETEGMASAQKYVRGFFTGGTLADEAWILLHRLTGAVYSNNQTDPDFILSNPRKSRGHTIVDLGDDAFTVGRPHPMIDPSTRTERIDAEAGDREIAVMLVDLVLGYGSHPDPAGELAPSLAAAKEVARKRGGRLAVVASVTGTSADFQGFAAQKARLEEAGAVVLPSNYQASMLAARIIERIGSRAGGGR
jgi:succinyl-CoA synthetase alpha subunit